MLYSGVPVSITQYWSSVERDRVGGGISLGALLTGVAVSVFGVRHAFLINGTCALMVQGAIMRMWLQDSLRAVYVTTQT